jgi:serine protease AprX
MSFRRQHAYVIASRALALVLLLTAAAFGGSKLSRDLPVSRGNVDVDIIVQFAHQPGDADVTRVLSKSHGKVKARFARYRGGTFTVPTAALDKIADDPNVVFISPDRKVSGMLEFAEPTVGADQAFQNGWTGYGVGVAVIDSGVMAGHSDLKPRVVYAENFVPGESPYATDDLYGHGTHVAGIIGGNATSSIGPNYIHTFRGIAPKANLINLRVLDSTGQGSDSAVISAIERAINLKDLYNIRIINLSLGRSIGKLYP